MNCERCYYYGKAADAPETVEEECMWIPSEEDGYNRPCEAGCEKTVIGISIERLREELSRGCEYSATQDIVHCSFLETMEELGGIGDWDEMAAEDIEGQMCVLQSLFEKFYDKTVEKIVNYIESYKEKEQ